MGSPISKRNAGRHFGEGLQRPGQSDGRVDASVKHALQSAVVTTIAIGVSLLSAVVAGSQAVAPAALSGALRDHVKNGRFQIVTSVRGLPLGVRGGLQTLFGGKTLDIAEIEAEFQATDVSSSRTCRSGGWSRRAAPSSIALSTMSAAASPTRGMWRCFTGRRPRLASSGAAPRQAAWRQSTMFGTPSCRG